MAPQYKLTYFNGRGRAEIARLIFAVAGVEYEDDRIQRDDWAAMKPKTPFGQLPILTVDGVQLCQSNAFARYLARKYNLAGKTDLESAQIDMIVDCVEDIYKPMSGIFGEKDEAKKAERKKKYADDLPPFVENLEKILKGNNGGDGFFVGNGLTWADLTVFHFRDFVTVVIKPEEFVAALGKCPKLLAFIDRVSKDPKVAAWLAKRPASDF